MVIDISSERRSPSLGIRKLERTSFKGSNLIVGVQGYMQKNPHAMTNDEKRLSSVTAVLKQLDSTVLSEGKVFTTALMAAAAKYADMTSFGQLIEALKRLVADVENGKDPLALKTYWDVYGGIKSGKGRKIRSIIRPAFLEYFRGCKQFEWPKTHASTSSGKQRMRNAQATGHVWCSVAQRRHLTRFRKRNS